MDNLHYFASHANGAKTPKDLCEALDHLGPLPRYVEKCPPVPRHFKKLGVPLSDWAKDNTIREAEPAIEDARAIYAHARRIAIRLRESQPDLPPLPPTETDPFLGLQTMQEWCIEGDKCWSKLPGDKSQKGQKGKGKPGRKPLRKSNPTKYQRYKKYAKEWATAKHKTYADCACIFGSNVQAHDIQKAVGYARKHPELLRKRRDG